MLEDAERNHRSWFGRLAEEVDVEGVTLFLAPGDATIAFPAAGSDPKPAVERALAEGVREIGCWALARDERLGARLTALGFQDGWQPHWMGLDPREFDCEQAQHVSETSECAESLPYASPAHRAVIGGHVHHFVAREAQLGAQDGGPIVGHAVLNVDGTTAGLYDMGVAAQHRRRGHGSALTAAAIVRARQLGCTSVTLNATGEGAPMYRRAGLRSLGLGMTWWMFPR